MIAHDYLSAGDNPYTSGDRVYRGCTQPLEGGELCGGSYREHRNFDPAKLAKRMAERTAR